MELTHLTIFPMCQPNHYFLLLRMQFLQQEQQLLLNDFKFKIKSQFQTLLEFKRYSNPNLLEHQLQLAIEQFLRWFLQELLQELLKGFLWEFLEELIWKSFYFFLDVFCFLYSFQCQILQFFFPFHYRWFPFSYLFNLQRIFKPIFLNTSCFLIYIIYHHFLFPQFIFELFKKFQLLLFFCQFCHSFLHPWEILQVLSYFQISLLYHSFLSPAILSKFLVYLFSLRQLFLLFFQAPSICSAFSILSQHYSLLPFQYYLLSKFLIFLCYPSLLFQFFYLMISPHQSSSFVLDQLIIYLHFKSQLAQPHQLFYHDPKARIC